MILYFQLKVLDHFKMSIDKNKNKVLKQYPNAYIDYRQEGVRIMSGDTYLAEEYFMPNTYNEDTAWEYAAFACRTTQNFNRTHPMKHDMVIDEKKFDRVSRRNRKKN